MKKSPAEEVNQAQKWFNYLQIPREATYSDVMMFKKIFEESLAERSERLEAERKVIEAAREVVPGLVKLERPTVKALEALLEKESESPIRINPDGSIGASPKMEVLRKALAHLDSLGGGK